MTAPEYSDEKLIALHNLPFVLIAGEIEDIDCPYDGKYSSQNQHCWRCDLSRECRWLNRTESGIETMQTGTLQTSLSYACKLVNRQLKQEKHFVSACLCERCMWLRGVRKLWSEGGYFRY